MSAGHVTGDFRRTCCVVDLSEFAHGDHIAVGGRHQEVPEVVYFLPEGVVEADHQVEAFFTFEESAGAHPGKGHGDHPVGIGDGDAVTGKPVAPEGNRHLGEPLHLIDGDVRCSFHAGYQRLQFVGLCGQDGKVVPVNFNGHVGSDARDEFVEAHLNGLGEFRFEARQYRESFLEFFGQLIFGFGRSPLPDGFQGDDDVGFLHGHGIRGDFSCADAGDHLFHFGKSEQDFFDFGGDADGGTQGGTGRKHRLNDEIALVEGRNEFAAHTAENQQGSQKNHQGGAQNQLLMVHGKVQHRLIASLEQGDDFVGEVFLFLVVMRFQEEGGHDGDIGQAEDKGPQEGKAESQGHRTEHLAFDAGEGENGDEDDHNDQLAEDGRFEHFNTAVVGDLVNFFLFLVTGEGNQCCAFCGEAEGDKFHDDDGTVDDDSEVYGSEAHQVGVDAKEVHQ